jgi:hypothetical protein
MGAGGKNILKITDEFKVKIKVPERNNAGERRQHKPKTASTTEEPAEGEEVDRAQTPITPSVVIEAGDAEAAAAAGANDDDGDNGDITANSGEAAGGKEEEAVPKERPILITGQPDMCAKAVEAIKVLVPVQETMDIPVQYHRLLIGQKGEDIRRLSDEANVRIKFPKGGDSATGVLIKGRAADIGAAKELIKLRMVELEDVLLKNFQLEVEVDPMYHPSIIGTKGTIINEIRKQFDINIDMPRRDGGKSNIIVITGYEKDAHLARDHILERVKELSSYVTLDVICDPRVRPRIIGQGGRGMHELQDKYNVRINFPRGEKAADEPVTVNGPEQACIDCRDEIELMAEDFMEDVLEREERREFERPASKPVPEKKEQQSKEFKLRNAPWNHNDASAFPSLVTQPAAAAGKAPSWGPKR